MCFDIRDAISKVMRVLSPTYIPIIVTCKLCIMHKILSLNTDRIRDIIGCVLWLSSWLRERIGQVIYTVEKQMTIV